MHLLLLPVTKRDNPLIDTSVVGNDAFVAARTGVPTSRMGCVAASHDSADQSREMGGDREECDVDHSRQAIDPVGATVSSHDITDM